MPESPELPRHRPLTVRHPRAHLALSTLAFVIALGFFALCVAVALGGHGVVWWPTIFWGGMAVLGVFSIRRARRVARDPDAEDRRVQDLNERVLAQPRGVLVRKAAALGILLSLAFLCAGVAMLILGSGFGDVLGWGMVGFGVFIAGYTAYRIRNPAYAG